MAEITNAEAIRFCNEQIRPLAERMRALKIEVDAALTTWFAGVSTVIGSSAGDTIEDGRGDEGVSRLTAADVTNLGVQMIAYQTQLNQAGVAGVVSKPCVRPVRVG